MKLIEWTDASQLEIGSFDDEHRQLVELINRLHDALHVRQPLKMLRPFLAELEAYANAHFEGEEQLMREHKFPADKIERHTFEHNEFRTCLRSLARQFDAGETMIRLDLWHFVASWWNRHVLGSDREMAQMFNADTH